MRINLSNYQSQICSSQEPNSIIKIYDTHSCTEKIRLWFILIVNLYLFRKSIRSDSLDKIFLWIMEAMFDFFERFAVDKSINLTINIFVHFSWILFVLRYI